MVQAKDKRTKIVLYHPKHFTSTRPIAGAPLDLLSICKLLPVEEYDIRIVTPNLYQEPDEKVLQDCENAICLGISAMTGYQIADGLHVARLVKQKYPNLPIVWGGWHPSLLPEQTLESPYVDIIVRGQGEITFRDVVDSLQGRKPLKEILGVSFKANGTAVHNPDRPFEDINNFPPIPYHLIAIEKCLYATEYSARTINYASSYGCPHRCGFCAEQVMFKRRWSGLDAERMADDIERLFKDYRIDVISINDSEFFTNKDRVRKFCEELINRKLPIKIVNADGRSSELLKYEDEIWHLMERSGFKTIFVGAESGCQETLDFITKDITVEDNIAFAESCKKYNIKMFASLLCGLPWDRDYKKTRQLIDKEIGLSLKLADKFISMNHRIHLNIYYPYPGTPLYAKSLELGFIPPKSLEEWGGWALDVKGTPWVTAKQARLVLQVSSIFFFMDPDSYEWFCARLSNRWARPFLKTAFKLFRAIARFRWQHKFFLVPVDFWLFRFVRSRINIPQG